MDAISTIPGLVDAAAFVDLSSTASGTKITAEIVQVLTKTNEVIAGLTEVAAQADESTADVGALEGRMTTAEADINALQAGTSGDLELNADATVTAQQIHDNAVIYCRKTGVTDTLQITLPTTRTAGTRAIAIYNNGFAGVRVGSSTVFRSGNDVGDVATGYLLIPSGGSLVLMPEPVGGIGYVRWAIMYGATAADVL